MKTKFIYMMLLMLVIVSSCRKFVEIDPPKNEVIASEAFKDDNSATSAVLGIYVNMLNSTDFENSGITIYSGLSADDLEDLTNIPDHMEFQRNQVLPVNGTLSSMWSLAYNNLVQVNTCIEGLEKSTTLSAPVKARLMGECKFNRAFVNFYLVNLWDNVPLITSTNWRLNAVTGQSSKTEVYASIVADLKEAQSMLLETYPSADKLRPNKWAATAMLARTYLYLGDYANAETQASAVIGAGIYGPLANLNGVFLKDSREAIWQLTSADRADLFATYEATLFLQDVDVSSPGYIITESLRSSFEVGDHRKTDWINQVDFLGQTYYYPFKYKDKGTFLVPPSEYYVMLRLSEQYLIRAEAKVQQGKLTAAMDDLNVIRSRAGLNSVQEVLSSVTKESLLMLTAEENRHEFFAEWGHRWMDLKRTGQVNVVLSASKPTWKATAANFPIPQSDMNVNSKLVQNPGY